MPSIHEHTLVVRNHRISCCDPVLVQHSMGHDAITLDLDDEWHGLSVKLVIAGQTGETYEVAYTGEPAIYLKPFYKCEQGYGSKLATNTSSVTIEYLGVG